MSTQQDFRILAIDGGGVKGVFAASFLATVEGDLGTPLVDHFDLITGTSTGGIIALGLGLGLSANEILNFYENNACAIFPEGRWRSLRWILSAKYDSLPLRSALEQVFGERLFGESLTRLVIPSTNFETGEVHVFKTAHHERFVRDCKESAVDVALATAAAPTYFPTHQLRSGTPLIDGGMWANNPMGIAAVEAVGLLELSKGSVKLLSVSCTESPLSIQDRSPAGLGFAGWARSFIDSFMAGQSSAALGTAQLLLGHDRVHRIAPSVGSRRYKLDRTDDIDSLKGLGVSEARKECPRVKSMFLTGKRPEFHPNIEVQA